MILLPALFLALLGSSQEAPAQAPRVVEIPLPGDAYSPARTAAWVFQSTTGGLVVEYTPDGSLFILAQFENEAKHGVEQTFYPDGRLFRERMFAGGNADGPVIEYFPDGTKSLEGTFVDGFFQGELRTYWPDGSLYQNGPMAGNARHGTWQSWMPGADAPYAQESWFQGRSTGQTILREMDQAQYAWFQGENQRRNSLLGHPAFWSRYLWALQAAPAGGWPRIAGLLALGPIQRATIEWDFRRFDADSDGSLSTAERGVFGLQTGSPERDSESWTLEAFSGFYAENARRAGGELAARLDGR
jgi:hypothetical protein